MRRLLPVFLLAASGAALPADAMSYRLQIDSSVQSGQLTVIPHVAAPAGSRLRYEMSSTKEGSAGKSSTSQSGTASVGENGDAILSTLRVSVGAQDRYIVTVKVFEGTKLVAERVLRYPQ